MSDNRKELMGAVIRGSKLDEVRSGHWIKDVFPSDVRDQWCFKHSERGSFYVSTEDGVLKVTVNCSTERIAIAMWSRFGGGRGLKWWNFKIDLGDPGLCVKLSEVWTYFFELVCEI